MRCDFSNFLTKTNLYHKVDSGNSVSVVKTELEINYIHYSAKVILKLRFSTVYCLDSRTRHEAFLVFLRLIVKLMKKEKN